MMKQKVFRILVKVTLNRDQQTTFDLWLVKIGPLYILDLELIVSTIKTKNKFDLNVI